MLGIDNNILIIVAILIEICNTNLKNDGDRWIVKKPSQSLFHNPKSKIQNPKWYDFIGACGLETVAEF
jgi:hypothetical protein